MKNTASQGLSRLVSRDVSREDRGGYAVALKRKKNTAFVPTALPCFASVDDAVAALRPAEPLHCMHPAALAENAALFLNHFPGDAYYAVKANADPYALKNLYAAGIHHFDVASLGEVKLVRDLFPDAKLAFMHPVKSREAIRAAYYDYDVRVFVLDSLDELNKIRTETDNAADVTYVVRLAMPKGSAAIPLCGKFGAAPDLAVALLRDGAARGHKVGLSFHVGSQSLDPDSYAIALRLAGQVIAESGVALAVLDVGGGFPIAGIGDDVQPLIAYFDVIRQGIAALRLPESCRIWGEPGAALAGNSCSVVVRVDLRKDNMLYINDGNFGALRDLCAEKRRNAVRMVRPLDAAQTAPMMAFSFYGPTCESMDYMPGPFLLPADIAEGDWIVVSNLGAYGMGFRTAYNGFYSDQRVEIRAPASARLLRMTPRPRKVLADA